MGQRRACSPKPLALSSVVCLFGFDDRPVQFNFSSDLETSTFSSCRKRNGTSVGFCSGREAPSPRTRGMLCLSSNQQTGQVVLGASQGLVLGARGLGACGGGPGAAWG